MNKTNNSVFALIGTVGFFVVMFSYVVAFKKLNSPEKFTIKTEAAMTKGITILDLTDTALVQCLGLELRLRDKLLSNNIWTGTQLTCVKPAASPTVIPTPSPVFSGGYYLYSRYAATTQVIEYTCGPNPPGKAPIRVIKPEWGRNAILFKCQ